MNAALSITRWEATLGIVGAILLALAVSGADPDEHRAEPPKLSIHKAIELAENRVIPTLKEDKSPRYLASAVYVDRADEPPYWQVTWKLIPPARHVVKGGEILVRVFPDESIEVLGGQ
jgi:hypothetical protein